MNNRNKRSDPESELYRAILQLKSIDECYDFFLDLCTVSELKAMEQRFEVAKLLNEGLIYNDILEKTRRVERDHLACQPQPQLRHRCLPHDLCPHEGRR